MAFQQPTRQSFQRTARIDTQEPHQDAAATGPPLELDESQTWVLFSPATDAGTSESYLSSVIQSQHTPGRSILSDVGSLETVARSDVNSQPVNSAVRSVVSDVMDEDTTEDDAELDSLDSHLPDFRSLPNAYHLHASATVLPTHDGLGSFRIDSTAVGSEMQDHIYAFERFNPRRLKRRRDGFEAGHLHLEPDELEALERNHRIELWRLEQSKLLLEEVQKETRRMAKTGGSQPASGLETSREEATTAATSTRDVAPVAPAEGSEWHDDDASEAVREPGGLWSRITRRFIHDFMGIDDRVLSILFGEALAEDEDMSAPEAPPASAITQAEESQHDSSWQLRMLEHVSKELGMFVHHLSENPHPGAFSTYVRMQQMPLPYAGLPVIPEAAAAAGTEEGRRAQRSSPPALQFRPTIRQFHPGGLGPTSESPLERQTQQATTFTQQEWEQDLDIKLVFRYLRSRFMWRSSSAPTNTPHLAMAGAQDAAARAARVRLHHPLVNRARPGERRPYRVVAPTSPVVLRHASTCASQSTRRSARRSSVSSRHSSRHYWDIGGSLGTGSLVASTGPMGSWGEV